MSLLTGVALAEPPDEDSGEELDMIIQGSPPGAPTVHGEPVKRVFAPNIHSWHVLDAQHLILYATRRRPYLVTLRYKARGLVHNQIIGLRRNGTSIDARFDDIIVDGFHYPIERIEKLTPEVAKRLRGIEVPTEEPDEVADEQADQENESPDS